MAVFVGGHVARVDQWTRPRLTFLQRRKQGWRSTCCSRGASTCFFRVFIHLFNVKRGSTYSLVTKSYSQSLAVLIGAVLGYLSSIIAVFAVLVRLLEKAALRFRKEKPQPDTLRRFNSVFEEEPKDVRVNHFAQVAADL